MNKFISIFRRKYCLLAMAWLGSIAAGYSQSSGQVVAWGDNTFGQTNISVAASNVVAIAGGGNHSLALRTNGTVTAWGNNTFNQTGVPGTLTGVIAISAGQNHSLALRSNGVISAWGQNANGQTTTSAAATNVIAVAAGWQHSLALRSNGTVVAWGAGTFQSSFSPNFGQSLVPTNLTGVTAIAGGGYHSLALRIDGTVVAWGWNAFGQTNVPAGLSNVVAIAAGGSNSIALKSDGTVLAWGANGFGQTNIPAGLSNVVAISAGVAHNLALKNDGTLVAWGLNTSKQTNVPAGLTNVAAVSAGGYHSLALVNTGPVTFLNQPYGLMIYKGSNAVFTVAFLGSAPVNCQWLLNGTNVPGATNATLNITNAQFTDAGNYQLVVSNAYGAVTSAAAVLTVNDTAPYITLQPTNAAVLQNSNVTLTVAASGLPPLTYQWLLNGTPISWATNPNITITNAQSGNEGFYSLVASNAYGTATSSNVFLNVIDVPEALGQTNLIWFNPGLPMWTPENTNTVDGFAVSSGPLASGQQTVLQTRVTGPGKITFWWSGINSVSMSFAIDGVAAASQMFSFPSFTKATGYVPAGVRTLTWTAANQFGSLSPPMGFLDQVAFTPGSTAVSFAAQPGSQTIPAGTNVTFNVSTIGTPPLSYQWYFNGGLIPGANAASLTLNNVQADATGSYSVTVSNASATATSSNAQLTVTPSSPVITTSPNGGPVLLGGAMTFSGGAIGTSPIYYQWLFNNVPVTNATGTSLTITNVQYSDGGNYSLLASNSQGTAVSASAFLLAYTMPDLGPALDGAGLTWTGSSTNVVWFPQTNITHDAVSAAQSGAISDAQQSVLQTVVTGPAMVVYWWKVNCDSFWDSLAFSDNGVIQNSITGNVDWQQVTNYIGSGSQTLQWSLYPVHAAFAGGTAWLDQVQVTPVPGTNVVITAEPVSSITTNAGNNVSLTVGTTGTPAILYQWLFNGTNLPGATNATLTLTNVQDVNAGTYAVAVTNAYGSDMSSDAVLTVNPSGPIITARPVNQTNVVGSSTTLIVKAKGTAPLYYQWYFNGSPITGQTSSTLVFASPQLTNDGDYFVTVSNQYGPTNTLTAHLTIVPAKVIEYWPFGITRYSAPPNPGDVMSIAAGALHTTALRSDGTVLAWGNNQYGQTNVPAGLSNVVAIAAGNYHSLALKADGTLAAWGDDAYSAVSLPAGLSNVVAIAAGPDFNLALKNDGTVTGWGNDLYGETDIPAGLANVRAIFTGYYNGFALTADGSLVQWGSTPVWQHNGTNTQLTTGTGMTNVAAVSAGSFSGWALQRDGTALAYGWFDGVAPFTNRYTHLSGSLSSWNTNSRAQSTYPGVAAIAAAGTGYPLYDYVFMLGTNGSLTQAGSSAGQGSIGQSYVPYIAFGTSPNNATAIAAAFAHAAALVNDGSPRLTGPAITKVVYTGTTVAFSASATGRSPLNYQWQFNGNPIATATNAVLVLTNVPLTAAGIYNCTVSNTVGVATNLNATLLVLRSTPRFGGSPAFSSGTGFSWQLDQLSGHGDIIILTSTNLTDWFPIYTNPPLTGTLQFLDPDATNQPARFYRAVEQ